MLTINFSIFSQFFFLSDTLYRQTDSMIIVCILPVAAVIHADNDCLAERADCPLLCRRYPCLCCNNNNNNNDDPMYVCESLLLRLSHSLLLACSLFSVAASTTVATTCCTKRCACAEKKNYMNTIFTIILQLRGACVCVFLTKFCWIIKCTFYALFYFLSFSALSTNFHLLWGTARRVTYNFWIRVKSERSTKQNEKNRRKLQTAHVQICTNTFLSNCMTV